MLACAVQSRAAAEPLAGTAPFAPAWLLVEEPGPWPRRSPGAVRGGRPDAAAMGALSDRFDRLPVRLQWIRDVGRRRVERATRRVYLVHPRNPRSGAPGWIERLDVAHAGTLEQLDHEILLSDDPPGAGELLTGPLVAVCTHAKKDTCCAANGRPAAEAVATWCETAGRGAGGITVVETTHLGGHRFAATFAVLPEGLVYGRTTAEEAVAIVAGHVRGQVCVAHLRGRAALDEWGQATETEVRRRLGLSAVDALRIGPSRAQTGGRWRVRCTTPAGEVAVELIRRPLGTSLLVGCAKDTPEDPGTIEVVDVRAGASDRTVASHDAG